MRGLGIFIRFCVLVMLLSENNYKHSTLGALQQAFSVEVKGNTRYKNHVVSGGICKCQLHQRMGIERSL